VVGSPHRVVSSRTLAPTPAKLEAMADPYWPLFDLRIHTPRLEIRLADDDDLHRLNEVADGGIHDPATMPFLIPWTDDPAQLRHRRSLQWGWSKRAQWSEENWTFTGVVLVDDVPIGIQDLTAERFAALRTVTTGSWIGRGFQGRGLGREMRTAILHLAFEGLGAIEAHSGAFHDNAASMATSRSLGYRPNGAQLALRRGQPDRLVNLVLDRDTWMSCRRDDITIDGLEACIEMFGVSPGL
jgi:RimJ/RimL family protein N-acetyltransferase